MRQTVLSIIARAEEKNVKPNSYSCQIIIFSEKYINSIIMCVLALRCQGCEYAGVKCGAIEREALIVYAGTIHLWQRNPLADARKANQTSSLSRMDREREAHRYTVLPWEHDKSGEKERCSRFFFICFCRRPVIHEGGKRRLHHSKGS